MSWNLDFRTFFPNILFFSINCLLCVLNAFQNCLEYLSRISDLYWRQNNFFPEFIFSYVIFHILSYFCSRMATLPVILKKEGKENYYLKPINCWHKNFLQNLFIQSSIPNMLFWEKNFCHWYQKIYFFL